MKHWTVWEWICFMFSATICSVVLVYFLGMFLMNQQTNELNLPLRLEIIRSLFGVGLQILAIAYIMITGKKLENRISELQKNKDEKIT